MVAVWNIDRLGRSLHDLVAFLEVLRAANCDLYLHRQGLNTREATGRAMFQMIGTIAEFEHAIIRERVVAGLQRARADGIKLGRPTRVAGDKTNVTAIRAMRRQGASIRAIAAKFGVSAGSVQRCLARP
jgi:DNA invertase Pin-like site-specific DNA recombinase